MILEGVYNFRKVDSDAAFFIRFISHMLAHHLNGGLKVKNAPE